MAKKLEIYKCNICGIITEIIHNGNGSLVCCGKPMNLIEENTVDAAVEKHVPAVEKTADGIKVVVGSVPHPMTEEHYIEWIEVIVGDTCVCQKYFKPGDAPEAFFPVKSEEFTVRAYCNLHGLWKAE